MITAHPCGARLRLWMYSSIATDPESKSLQNDWYGIQCWFTCFYCRCRPGLHRQRRTSQLRLLWGETLHHNPSRHAIDQRVLLTTEQIPGFSKPNHSSAQRADARQRDQSSQRRSSEFWHTLQHRGRAQRAAASASLSSPRLAPQARRYLTRLHLLVYGPLPALLCLVRSRVRCATEPRTPHSYGYAGKCKRGSAANSSHS